MIYVSVLVFALIFFFGVSRSAELAAFLEHREQRRNLVLRMLGFLAMSSWIHAIPSILLSVCMRENKILASELFAGDVSRATLVGVFVLPTIVATALLFSSGAIVAAIFKHPFRLGGRDALIGYAAALAGLSFLAFNKGRSGSPVGSVIGDVLFLAVTAAPLAMYLTMTLHLRTEKLIALYWLPFGAIVAVTYSLVHFAEYTSKLVAEELRAFGAGGYEEVIVIRRDLTTHG